MVKYSGKCRQIVREILWKWEMPKRITCLFKSYYMPILKVGQTDIRLMGEDMDL
jgi:hypothetical protein